MKKLLLLIITAICLSGFRAPISAHFSTGEIFISPEKPGRTYRIDQYKHRFIVENGRIVADDWSRF